MALLRPPSMCPTVPVWVQFFEVTAIILFLCRWWVFLFLLILFHKDILFCWKMIDLITQYLIFFYQLEDSWHQLINMTLIGRCIHGEAVESKCNILCQDHVICTVINRLSQTELMGEIWAVILSCKELLKINPRLVAHVIFTPFLSGINVQAWCQHWLMCLL